MADLRIESTPIDGLLVVTLPVHGDNRGWFKEGWQRQKMVALGLPDFGPVQQNVSFNAAAGATRGIHAEPWDKFVSLVTGRAFGAWVDLRPGDGFGTVFTIELTPEVAVFVPRGVANSYQTLEDATAYGYLVNEHWRPDVQYTGVNPGDASLDLAWPIPLDRAELSDKDRDLPVLADVAPMPPRTTVILGANGQVGCALRAALPAAVCWDRDEIDLADPISWGDDRWDGVGTIINAAAYTQVDLAETPEGRRDAWAVNVTAVAALVRVAASRGITLVHLSSDYVFDGRRETHGEDEPFTPLGVYGQTKAAGDALVAQTRRHYVVRTSWVIGDGANFVRTMARLAADGVSPSVVEDQVGRLSFADEIARGIVHLLGSGAPYGTYNLTGSGEPTSWAGYARRVFALRGRSADDVSPVSTQEYAAGKDLAPRPAHSTLDLARIESTGFVPRPVTDSLADYLSGR